MNDGYHSAEAKATRDRMAQRIHDQRPGPYHQLLGIDPERCRRCQRT